MIICRDAVVRALLLAPLLCACRREATPGPPPPRLAVSLVLDGADAPTIERDVDMPVEAAASTVPGVRSIASRIEADQATVTLELAPRADVERATHELHHALGVLQPALPAELSTPQVQQLAGDTPVLWLAVGGTLPIAMISARVHDEIKPVLERVPGVSRVELRGLAEEVVVVQPDPEVLAAAGVTVFDVIAALQAASSDVPAGPGNRARGTAVGLEGIELLTIRHPRQLRDLAMVTLGHERSPAEPPAIAIHARPQTDREAVAKAVRARLAFDDVQLVEKPAPSTRRPSLVVSLRGPDLGELARAANALANELERANIAFERDPQPAEPERTYSIDRDQAARLALPMPDIAATVRALAGAHAGTVVVGDKPRDVIVRVPLPKFELLRVRSQRGDLVPITSVVTATAGTTQTILRRDREREVVLAVHGDATAARPLVKKHAVPPGYRIVVTP